MNQPSHQRKERQAMSQEPINRRPMPDDQAERLARRFQRLAEAINNSETNFGAAADTADPQYPRVDIYLNAVRVDTVTYNHDRNEYRWGAHQQHTHSVAPIAAAISKHLGLPDALEMVLATAGRDVVSVAQMTEWLCRDMLGAPVVDSQVDGVWGVSPDHFTIDLANGQRFTITVAEVFR